MDTEKLNTIARVVTAICAVIIVVIILNIRMEVDSAINDIEEAFTEMGTLFELFD